MSNENLKLKEESDIYPCSSCGANMHYNPKTEGMYCEFCSSSEEIEKVVFEKVKEYRLDQYKEDEKQNLQEERIIHCDNCGAETSVCSDTKAVYCPFCGSSHIIKENQKSGRIMPETIIPFKLDKNSAKENFNKWIKKKWLAPRKLKVEAESEKLQGVYIPYWTYDSDTSTDYVAERGTHYYVSRTVTRNGKKTTERERRTRWKTVRGHLDKYYDDIMVPASNKHQSDLLDRIDNFNLANLIKYNPKFLSGFMAERYSVNLQDGWIEGQERIDKIMYSDIRREVGGDEFRLTSKNTIHKDVLYKHFLVPLWISNYMYRGKLFQYVINGENGKVEGYYPKSYFKIAGLVILALGIGYLAYKYISQN